MSPQNILISQTAFIGDVILITPLIRAVNELYPSANIDVMVTPQTAGILENNPYVSNVILFDKRKNKITSFVKTLFLLRKKKFDMAISPHSSLTTALLLYFARIPKRIGFDRWSAAKYLTDKVPHPEGIHKTIKNLSLLRVLSDKKFSNQTELFPTERMFRKADKIISSLPEDRRGTIAIAPGSVWFTKKWPAEYYKQLTDKLIQNNFAVVLIGSQNERNLCNTVLPHKNGINLAGKLSLIESAAVISKCDLMICNDSGALHIANAMQTDVFAFFGPTIQSIGYFPFRENDFVFEVDMECRPCGSHGGNKCPLVHHNCMKEIKPDFVFKKIIERYKA